MLPGDEFVVIEDDIAADSRVIPIHGDEGWDNAKKHILCKIEVSRYPSHLQYQKCRSVAPIMDNF